MPRTLAALVDYMDLFGGGFEVELRDALQAACSELDLDLWLVYGRALAHPDAAQAAHNAVYERIHPERVDGLIAFSPALCTYTGPSGLERLFERAQVGARCSAGIAVPGTPSIVIDNGVGMRALLEHVVSVHGYRRVAFIGGPPGNPDAEARFAAYRAALSGAGLSFDPALVAHGDFVRRSGEAAMEELLRRGPPPRVVVAANDGMALGAISALQRHGLQVPQDVAVTGFDDLPMARLADPPLTTVAQPLRSMMRLAVELVVAQWRGERVADVTGLHAELMLRDSCGCAGSRPRSDRGLAVRSPDAPAAHLSAHAAGILARARDLQPAQRPAWRADLESLCAGLGRELGGEQPGLLDALQRVLSEIGPDNERRQALQVSVGLLRDELQPVSTPRIDQLFHDARDQRSRSPTAASRRSNGWRSTRRIRCSWRRASSFRAPSISRACARAWSRHCRAWACTPRCSPFTRPRIPWSCARSPASSTVAAWARRWSRSLQGS